MLTARKIRARWIQELRHSVARPEMYGGELCLRIRLSDLAAIDEREDELKTRMSELSGAGLSTCVGVEGWFQSRMPSLEHIDSEVASVYARVAALLDWLRVARRLSEDDLQAARKFAGSVVRRGCTSEEVLAELGRPSLVIGHGVHVYASEEPEAGWLYLDYLFEPPSPGHHCRHNAPASSFVLRDIRVPTSRWYSERLRFTPKGRRHVGR